MQRHSLQKLCFCIFRQQHPVINIIMADEFQNQLSDSKSYNVLGFEERLGLLVDAEWNRCQANKLKNLIKRAAFSVSAACIEDIEYLPDQKLDKTQMIRFSACQYINEGHHII